MTDKFTQKFGDPWNDEDDKSYRPWRTCQQGATASLRFVPTEKSGQPERYIPYLQPITIEFHKETDQVCLLCHSTNTTIFIEGQGLAELATAISERRVKSVHVFDEEQGHKLENGKPIVTNIIVEQSS